MSESRRLRLSALLAGVAVLAATLVPALPAAAEDTPPPTPAPVVEPTPAVEPVETPTPTPSADPTPVVEPVETPIPTPEVEPVETSTPTPDPVETTTPTIQYAGTFAALADSDDSPLRLFQVNDRGFLAVDTTGFGPGDLFGTRVATFEVPAGLVLKGDAAAQFTQLASASVKDPLTLISTRFGLSLGKETAALVNQTPNAPATHRIYAVLVTPSNGAKAPNQTAAKVATAVTALDDYWNQQSGGSVRFTLSGTTSWYKSANSCMNDAGSTKLWNQAAGIAKTQLGYKAGRNNHLVLFFPSTQACDGGAIGLGTIGDSANVGGVSWVVGTDAPTEIATLAHEIGHNLSLGHANWLDCTSSTPNPGFIGTSGCTEKHYGDKVDVMGIGDAALGGGALSSAQAIRSSIWPASAWETAGVGATTRTLNTVASNTGLRAIVVQDDDGVNYFVEFRAFDGEDAPYSGMSCTGNSCVAATPGVRILRLENNAQYFNPTYVPNGFLGYAGDNSQLIGRTVSSVKKVQYVSGETWWSKGGTGIRVDVGTITATTAQVTITKVANTVTGDPAFYINPSDAYDGSSRVGDTWTAMAGAKYDAQNTTFQWYRGTRFDATEPIDGATSQNYTLRAADVGKYIRVVMTGTSTASSITYSDPTGIQGYGPIVKGVTLTDSPASASVTNTGASLQAVPANWHPDRGAYQYQWFRGATATTATTAIPGATGEFYTLTAADSGKFVRARITTTISGFTSTTSLARYSSAVDYSIKNGVPPVITGTPKLGTEVTATASSSYTDAAGGALSGVTVAYQWLRNGVPITDSIAATADASDDLDYTLRSGDFNAKVTLRITATKTGYAPLVQVSAPFTPTIKGTITATSPTLSLVNQLEEGAPLGMRIIATQTGVTEPDTTATTQWYRVNRSTGVATAIPGATLSAYRPVQSDWAFAFRAVLTVKKTNYDNLPLTSADRDFSLRLAPAQSLGFGGQPIKVNSNITANSPLWQYEASRGSYANVGLGTPGLTADYRFRANGAQVGTTWAYTIQPADLGKVLSYTVTTGYGPLIPFIGTSPNSAAVAPDVFTPINQPNVSNDPDPNKKTKRVYASIDDVSPVATSITYQWFRNGSPIAGQTGAAYTIGTADYGTTTSVVVSYLRQGYQTYPMNGKLDHSGANTGQYWLQPNVALPQIVGDLKVGSTLSVASRSYQDKTNGDNLPSGQVGELIQWYRSGTLVATADTYELKTADKGKVITVKVTATATLRSEILPSVSTSAPTQAIGTQIIEGGTAMPTPTLVIDPSTTTFSPVLAVPDDIGVTDTGVTVAYQWFRGPISGAGTAITGATKQKYTLTAADHGKWVWARVTVTKKATTTSTWTPVVKETTRLNLSLSATSTPNVNVPSDLSTGAELAPTVPGYVDVDGDPVTGTQSTFQWYRTTIVSKKATTVAIPGATDAYYYVQAADVGATITVRVTTGKLNYLPYIATATTVPPTLKVLKGTLLNTLTAPTVTLGNPATNELLATPPVVTGQILFPSSATQKATFTYQWLRNGAAIKGATTSKFKLTSADAGKTINVRVVANLAGYNSATLPLSAPTDYSIRADLVDPPEVVASDWSVGQTATVADLNFDTKDGDLASPSIAYQWLRNGTPISGATGASYTMAAADYATKVTARLTVSTPGYVTLVHLVPQTATVGKGVTTAQPVIAVVPGAGLGTLTVQATGLVPAAPAPAYTYVWLRNGSPISGATAKNYTLVAADRGKSISVKVTMKRVNFTVVTTPFPPTTGVDYTLYADGAPAIDDATPQLGETLTALPPTYHDADGTVVPAQFGYQWYRGTTLIANATNATYTVVGADVGKLLKVTVIARHPGRLATSQLTAVAAAPVPLVMTGSKVKPIVTGSGNQPILSVTLAPGTITTPAPYTLTYDWLINGVSTGVTGGSYGMNSGTEYDQLMSVIVTVKKPGYHDVVLPESTRVNRSVHRNGTPVITGTPVVGQTLTFDDTEYSVDGTDFVPVPGDDYVWYWTDGLNPKTETKNQPTYVIQPGDAGREIRVLVQVFRNGWVPSNTYTVGVTPTP